MLDISSDIQSLSYFKRHTPEAVKKIKKTGRPMVLTIEGKAEIVVQDAAEYQHLLECREQLLWLRSLHRSILQDEQGKTRPLSPALSALRAKYAL